MINRNRRVSRIALAVSLSLALVACGGGAERQAKYLERAQEHLDAGDTEKARLDVKNALQINANSAQARYMMAMVEEKEKNWKAVFQNLNAALELDPKHVMVQVKLSQLYLLAGDPDKAAGHVEAAFALEPKNPAVLAQLALVELKKDDREKARQHAEAALQLEPGNVAATGALANYYGQAQADKALEVIDRGIKVNPDSPDLRLLRISVLESLGREDDVVAEYRQLIDAHPEELYYAFTLSNYLADKFREDEAEQVLRDYTGRNPGSEKGKATLVRFLGQHRGTEAAVKELESQLAADPEDFTVRNALGALIAHDQPDRAVALYKEEFNYDTEGANAQSARVALAKLALVRGDTPAAQKWIKEALDREAANTEALLIRAQMKLKAGEHAEAIPDLRMILRTAPDSVPAMILLAQAQLQEGSASLALDNYRKVLELQPENPVALFQAARLLSSQQEYEQAEPYVEKLLELRPNDLQVVSLYTEILAQQQRWPEAEQLLEKLEQQDDTALAVNLLKANLALRQGQMKEAETLARQVLEQDDTAVQAVPIVVQSLAAQKDLAGALAYLQAYLEKHPDQGSLYELEGRLYLASQQPDQAVSAFQQAIAVNPAQISAYLQLVRVYTAQGKVSEIENVYKQGLAANPDSPVLKTELAVHYQRTGQLDQALAVLEEANTAHPGTAVITNNLATLLVNHFPTEENLRRAQEMTQPFEDSNNPAMLDTAGWVQYKLGNIPQAVALLKAAQAKGGQGPEYWYHLGMAYLESGQKDLAKEQLGKALAAENARFDGREDAEKAYQGL